jgi:hypothetical protein
VSSETNGKSRPKGSAQYCVRRIAPLDHRIGAEEYCAQNSALSGLRIFADDYTAARFPKFDGVFF